MAPVMDEIRNSCVSSQLEYSKQIEKILALPVKDKKAGASGRF